MNEFQDATQVTMNAYQHIAPNYAETHRAAVTPSFWQERLQCFADIVRTSPAYQSNPSLPIADIGCGPGRDALQLAQMGFNVLATDLSEAMLNEARQRCQDQPEAQRITFLCMDMRTLNLPDASCAGLWISASFLHIPKSENLTVLKELVRVLLPGGAMMLLVKECDSGEAERYEVHEQTGQTRFFARYRGSELWDLLERAGLTVIEMTTAIDLRFADGRRWLGALASRPTA